MGKFDAVLLASDFDGTLTGNNGLIPEINIDAVKYFISEGGRFTVSTGRTKAGFHKFSESYINAPVILGNGAMAYDYMSETEIFSNSINKTNADILKKIFEDNPFLSIEFYSVDHKTFTINPGIRSFEHFKGLKIENFNIISEITEDIFPLVKVMLCAGEKTFEVQDYLRSIDMGEMKFIPCDGDYVEILYKNAGKGKALYQLADYYGISKNNVYAVGDGSNDVDMIEAAAVGFVPFSGDRLAKAVADKIVCSSDNGAVADVIGYLDSVYN